MSVEPLLEREFTPPTASVRAPVRELSESTPEEDDIDEVDRENAPVEELYESGLLTESAERAFESEYEVEADIVSLFVELSYERPTFEPATK